VVWTVYTFTLWNWMCCDLLELWIWTKLFHLFYFREVGVFVQSRGYW
jgi:hypothetical protein